MARSCLICSDSAKLAKAAQLVAAGSSDQAVANALNAMTPSLPPMSYMSVLRHRQNHIEGPARALADAAGKGREVAAQRAQMLAAAEAGDDPVAYLALAPIVARLRQVDDRLERASDAAEQAGHPTALAALSGSALRAIETRAKLGGVGGYRTPTTHGGPGGSGGPRFSVNIYFSNGQQETITTIDNPSAPEVDESESDE